LGCPVDAEATTQQLDQARELAARAEVCVLVLGDRAGLFGRGTSGEGCDVTGLNWPGGQEELFEAVLGTGTPTVLVALAGRPYAVGVRAGRLAGFLQAYFPGEEGGPAVAAVLSGRVNPSGRSPMSLHADAGVSTATYLAPLLGRRSEVSVIDPTAQFPFGFGLSYTRFEWSDAHLGPGPVASTEAEITVGLTVRNIGGRRGVDVVQLYLHDPVAEVTRPVMRLIGYARVDLAPGQAGRVAFRVHTDLASYPGRAGHRVVDPGLIELRLARSSAEAVVALPIRLEGPQRLVGFGREMVTGVEITLI
jgi:beta-xylosidase